MTPRQLLSTRLVPNITYSLPRRRAGQGWLAIQQRTTPRRQVHVDGGRQPRRRRLGAQLRHRAQAAHARSRGHLRDSRAGGSFRRRLLLDAAVGGGGHHAAQLVDDLATGAVGGLDPLVQGRGPRGDDLPGVSESSLLIGIDGSFGVFWRWRGSAADASSECGPPA